MISGSRLSALCVCLASEKNLSCTKEKLISIRYAFFSLSIRDALTFYARLARRGQINKTALLPGEVRHSVQTYLLPLIK
ncbi:hypothetical protein ROD_12331 [Citrobacter rodentium ICC168]|uniref:Uncharacterized protein n=1 Tax=Citrobacter rodentium (strain ICC168) TaxID=637910 RepID=D2TUE3_CITRI|nr:hypothetical protein ROD_12331 [Citrobacter rodentium ICC168]